MGERGTGKILHVGASRLKHGKRGRTIPRSFQHPWRRWLPAQDDPVHHNWNVTRALRSESLHFVQNLHIVPTNDRRLPSNLQSERTGEAMKKITTAEARKRMSELLNRAAYGKERFVLTRHGKELVAIVPLEDVTLLDRLKTLLERRDFESAMAEIDKTGTLAWDDVRRDLDL
jgi:prevent-host-death family protein